MILGLKLELKLKLSTTSPMGGWWVGGWTETKSMLILTQVEVVVKVEVELGKSTHTQKSKVTSLLLEQLKK